MAKDICYHRIDELFAYWDLPTLKTCVACIDAVISFIPSFTPSSGLSEVACNVALLFYLF